jgi:FkbM family methyltransferase
MIPKGGPEGLPRDRSGSFRACHEHEVLAEEKPPGRPNGEQRKRTKRIWIDVGAHLGERTLEAAQKEADLIVYAFEPNLKVAVELFGVRDNFVVIPMAVAQSDGFSPFFLNRFSKASSLLPFNPKGLETWIDNEQLEIEKKVVVPTIRLDTFLNLMGIGKVDLLKIDAQGGDFGVVLSAGNRLKDIRKIILEVVTNPLQLYSGAATKSVVVDFLQQQGFIVTKVQEQSQGQEENLTFERLKDNK